LEQIAEVGLVMNESRYR